MKAIILAAGIGSRIRPLTDNKPKSLLEVAGKTILERMISNIIEVGIEEVIVITGYLEEQIKEYVQSKYPSLNVVYIRNEDYLNTNTGVSLLLSKEAVSGDDFVKFDADVVFEVEVLQRLINDPSPSCLCIDKNINLAAEEVKVRTDENGEIVEVGKGVDPEKAAGESIGIEKISNDAAKVLFKDLENLMKDPQNYKRYYDDSYTTLVNKGVPFKAVDITGLKWVEIDTHQDYEQARKIFNDA